MSLVEVISAQDALEPVFAHAARYGNINLTNGLAGRHEAVSVIIDHIS